MKWFSTVSFKENDGKVRLESGQVLIRVGRIGFRPGTTGFISEAHMFDATHIEYVADALVHYVVEDSVGVPDDITYIDVVPGDPKRLDDNDFMAYANMLPFLVAAKLGSRCRKDDEKGVGRAS